jgi:hypothetical protein
MSCVARAAARRRRRGPARRGSSHQGAQRRRLRHARVHRGHGRDAAGAPAPHRTTSSIYSVASAAPLQARGRHARVHRGHGRDATGARQALQPRTTSSIYLSRARPTHPSPARTTPCRRACSGSQRSSSSSTPSASPSSACCYRPLPAGLLLLDVRADDAGVRVARLHRVHGHAAPPRAAVLSRCALLSQELSRGSVFVCHSAERGRVALARGEHVGNRPRRGQRAPRPADRPPGSTTRPFSKT